MTGIERIINKINEDAEVEYRRIVDEARTQADTILTDAAAAARSNAASVLENTENERAEVERRAMSMAGLEVRKMRLELKQKLLQRAFDEALGKLTGMPEADYEKLLVSLASDAAQDGAKLVFSPADREKHGKAVVEAVNAALRSDGAAVSLSDETRNIPGGVIVINGRVEINCAFDALLNDRREELTAEIAKILF